MDDKKRIIIVVSTIVLAIAGFALTKYLTRNIVREKYITYIYEDYDDSELINSNEIP
jgi:hypothetical protein